MCIRDRIQAEEGKLRKQMHSDGFTARYDFSHILYRDSCMEAVINLSLIHICFMAESAAPTALDVP